jgi:hypothetical protein
MFLYYRALVVITLAILQRHFKKFATQTVEWKERLKMFRKRHLRPSKPIHISRRRFHTTQRENDIFDILSKLKIKTVLQFLDCLTNLSWLSLSVFALIEKSWS